MPSLGDSITNCHFWRMPSAAEPHKLPCPTNAIGWK